MPRLLDPTFLAQVRELAAKGYNQTQIAKKLHTNQPRIWYIMRHHAIPTENYAAAKRHARAAAAGALKAHVYLTIDGKPVQGHEHVDATPEQLEALAAYLRGMEEQAEAQV